MDIYSQFLLDVVVIIFVNMIARTLPTEAGRVLKVIMCLGFALLAVYRGYHIFSLLWVAMAFYNMYNFKGNDRA